jgi:hypothetical protein
VVRESVVVERPPSGIGKETVLYRWVADHPNGFRSNHISGFAVNRDLGQANKLLGTSVHSYNAVILR